MGPTDEGGADGLVPPGGEVEGLVGGDRAPDEVGDTCHCFVVHPHGRGEGGVTYLEGVRRGKEEGGGRREEGGRRVGGGRREEGGGRREEGGGRREEGGGRRDC
jgi:hypothetical protein